MNMYRMSLCSLSLTGENIKIFKINDPAYKKKFDLILTLGLISRNSTLVLLIYMIRRMTDLFFLVRFRISGFTLHTSGRRKGIVAK